ncbi:MAG: hypothetical protein JOS17DRAFT_777673 [Linnemannia elongata]|nr:MAG: hypothetical protein JOS17DRAFT_777673 [Linnemannia elongata]
MTLCYTPSICSELSQDTPLTTMNNYPLSQLDANVPAKESSDTIQLPLRKLDKFRKYLGLLKSLAIVKATSSTQSLASQEPSQQSTQSFGASQVDDNQDSSLAIGQTDGLLRSVIFPENVAKLAVKTALPGLQERIERTEQLLYCSMLLQQDSVISMGNRKVVAKKGAFHMALISCENFHRFFTSMAMWQWIILNLY